MLVFFLILENVGSVHPSKKTRSANFNGTLVFIFSCFLLRCKFEAKQRTIEWMFFTNAWIIFKKILLNPVKDLW
ncbi:hypothetical protein D1816_20585 [Aquimarina sp. AD10]|nr:hypothetical protein D1816_20585 [Aquimarina sp. AD10]RKM98355.1 hypothetical protein D7033_13070 [Aquimarina sp. AD10]